MTPSRARGKSPDAPRRLVQTLDVDGDDVPCVNYKKLLREQGGADARTSAEKGKDRAEPTVKSPRSLLEGGATGGGGHMAAVIRRIEALYQGGRGNASSDEDEEEEDKEEEDEDEDEEDEEGESGEEDGEADDDGESGEEEDSGSEMEDPDDQPTMTPNGTSRVIQEPTKPKTSEEKKEKPAKKKKKAKKKNGDVDWYDVDDDFIDDDELDEYFEDDGLKTKHSGFFINRGELQRVDEEGRTPVKRALEDESPVAVVKEKGRVAKKPKATEWTEEAKKLLRKAVTMYGKQWRVIQDLGGEFDELKAYSTARMAKQWTVLHEELIARGIDIVIPVAPPKPPSSTTLAKGAEDGDAEDGLNTPKRMHQESAANNSSQKKPKKPKVSDRDLDETDPRHSEAKKRVVESKDGEFAKLKAMVETQCDTIRTKETSKASDEAPKRFTFEWTDEIADFMYCTLSRLFFALPKKGANVLWKEVEELWPKDFEMQETTLRKKHTSVQKKKTAAEKQAIIGLPGEEDGTPA
ncbi:hypothetical protein BE221DRAFT_62278 [Ostreococcus tauri]|uniref:Hpc2-related domain-containing protein n=1 Tax=Ostreococcus tauri TaxID=70448 RepID=A0A1Y5HZD7_OSTTA|nr:hypothetical protein BE221DRAFT_62278 [Ostreococcus tauri]